MIPFTVDGNTSASAYLIGYTGEKNNDREGEPSSPSSAWNRIQRYMEKDGVFRGMALRQA
ncbi:hypothetical protein M5W84_08155 [Paenibacillus thiaminolyticus]|nr:hypothetical protein [Paenibacillus thiaminolyticus]MCY9632724.1 hypothetical protein [Paenibacillus thiaminolyticus]MCY9653433.1 hypothetical protein [Paenibacillus thiaminolyticus]